MRYFRLHALAGLVLLCLTLTAVADVVDELLKEFNAGDAQKQMEILDRLKDVKDPRVTRTAIAVAGDDNVQNLSVRVTAINVIRVQRMEEALDTMLKLAENTEEPFTIRKLAMFAVVDLSGSDHADMFMKFIREDEDQLIKQTAAVALGNTGDADISTKTASLMDDPKTARYGLVVIALSGDTKAVPGLIDMLQTDDLSLRYSVINTLGRLGDERAAQPLMDLLANDDPRQRIEIVSALKGINTPEVVTRLVTLMSDRNADQTLRMQALLSMGQMKAVNAIPSISRVALDKGEPVQVRHTAVVTLGHLGDESIPALLQLLDEQAVGARAGLSLGEITGGYFGTNREEWTKFCEQYKKNKQAPQR